MVTPDTVRFNRIQSAIVDWQDKPNKAPTSDMICHLIEDYSDNNFSENINVNENENNSPLVIEK